jgi:hypothetical protein
MRYSSGLEPRSSQTFRKRLTFNIVGSPDWEGAKIDVHWEEGRPAVQLIPQIAVRGVFDKEFSFFNEYEFAKATDEEIGVQRASWFKIMAPNTQSFERMINLLAARVPNVRLYAMPVQNPLGGDGKIGVRVLGRIEAIIARAVAKIAFNYLTFICGSDFALSDCFNPLRSFVINGTGRWTDFVDVNERPILGSDSERWRQTAAHLLVLEWDPAGPMIIRFSPFNDLTYHIHAGNVHGKIWRRIDSGHGFDWRTRSIVRMGSISRSYAVGVKPNYAF